MRKIRERPRSLLAEREILAAAAVSEQHSEAKGTGGAQSDDEDTTAGAATSRWAIERNTKAGGSKTAEEKHLYDQCAFKITLFMIKSVI